MRMSEEFDVLVQDDPGVGNCWFQVQKPRAYCRRLARQLIWEGIAQTFVVRLDDGEIVCSYTPDNAPVAPPYKPGERCPLRSPERKKPLGDLKW